MIFEDEFIADHSQIRSVLDYSVQIKELPQMRKNYVALTGNYSVAGFELTLHRKVHIILIITRTEKNTITIFQDNPKLNANF